MPSLARFAEVCIIKVYIKSGINIPVDCIPPHRTNDLTVAISE